ncbi:MAG: PD-(D/E)XK nuclease family protein [Candidatus Berkiella sp.]
MMDNKLVDYLKDNSTIITPSRRLASSLLAQANHHFAKSEQVWPTPAIFALQDWLHALWQQLEIQGSVQEQLLTPAQSLLVWTSIIRSVAIGPKLLNVPITAKMAQQAYGLLQEWGVTESCFDLPLNVDQETFKEFALKFQQWLTQHQAIDSHQLISAIQPYMTQEHHVAWHRVSPVKIVAFYGFEEITPATQQLIKTLQQQAWSVTLLEGTRLTPSFVGRKSFYDQEQEFLAAANFAKNRLEQGKKSIGIVVPDLANQRTLVEKTLKEVFQPLGLCEPQAMICEQYNISAAIPLDHYPIIHSAFAFLKMVSGSFSLKEYLEILNSPFYDTQQNELSCLLQHFELLKANHQKSLLLKTLVSSLPDSIWRETISKIITMINSLPKKNTYAAWATLFQQILLIGRWPGARPLNSIEHQAVARWFDALAELRLVDSVLGLASFKEALSVLRGIVAQIPFQAQSKGASVQVLGVLEALGLHFDCVWVVGLHSEAWPPLAKPNPFIPVALQRDLKMPHASAEREMEYARTMTERLLTCAHEVILSYPTREKAKILDPSELCRHIPLLEETFANEYLQHERLESRFKPHIALEKFIANEDIPLQHTEKIAATCHLLTLQAACPFKAFAELRLNAVTVQEEEDWLAPYQQGIILHDVLQHFWGMIKTQQALINLEAQELSALLLLLIEQQLPKHIKPNTPLPYLQVEKSRLLLLLHDYLHIEKSRYPFTVIATECSKAFNLQGMQFKVRLDRIDKTLDNQTLLIDYKTGEFSMTGIWGDRPRAPQLPLYYLAAYDEDPQGLLVAKLNRQTMGYEGISMAPLGIEGVKEPKFHTWNELKSYWSGTLGNLVASFQRGDTTVSPLDVNTTCRYCDLRAFCRINESEHHDS